MLRFSFGSFLGRFGDGDEISVALSDLGNLDLDDFYPIFLHKDAAKRSCLGGGDAASNADFGGKSGLFLGGEEVENGSLNRLVGDLRLGGLGGAAFVALVEFQDCIGSKGAKLGRQVLVGEDSGVEFTVSHITTFLPHYVVDTKFFIQ